MPFEVWHALLRIQLFYFAFNILIPLIFFCCLQPAPDIGGAQGSLSSFRISTNQLCTRSSPCSVPAYDNSAWSTPGALESNNCYNYATNSKTSTFAQPGRAAGNTTSTLTGEEVRDLAVLDGLLDHRDTGANSFPNTRNCLGALVIIPGIDFHFYRRDSDDNWSHKPGPRIPTNLDNSGSIITDPRTADIAPYKFVRFLSFCPFKATIS